MTKSKSLNPPRVSRPGATLFPASRRMPPSPCTPSPATAPCTGVHPTKVGSWGLLASFPRPTSPNQLLKPRAASSEDRAEGRYWSWLIKRASSCARCMAPVCALVWRVHWNMLRVLCWMLVCAGCRAHSWAAVGAECAETRSDLGSLTPAEHRRGEQQGARGADSSMLYPWR